MSKKVLIYSAIILVIFVLALGGYYFIINSNQNISEGKKPTFSNFFPFGGSTVNTQKSSSTEQEIQPTPKPELNFTQKLRELSSEPVAGAGVLDSKAGTSVRYIEKATGHIFEIELFSANQNRISNTTIPVVYDAQWGNNNNSLIARYLKDDNTTIQTYSLTVNSTSTDSTISGNVFPDNITDAVITDKNIFYIQETDAGSMGVLSNIDGSKKKEIWNSQIREVLPQFVNAQTVALTTKPAQSVPGFLYFVNTASAQRKQILGPIDGLSTLTNPAATEILGLSSGNGAQFFAYTLSNGLSTSLSPATFPEKCVWSKKDTSIAYCAVPSRGIDGSSLISWYMGLSTYSDNIWRFDIKNNISVIIENLSADSGQAIDVIKPILSDNEQYLVFMNKKDNTLWSLDMTK